MKEILTAQEAKKLYDESGAEVKKFLLTIEPHIIKEAKAGKLNTFFLLGSDVAYKIVTPTPLQSAIMTSLHNLGYRVQFVSKYGEAYKPRGLVDDDGDGPTHYNYGFSIYWD